ncbi:metalloregulator ArsR/SmtB family transcription factor [Parachitinimonas caeni]|uniref:Metalloregulator ArsR/SmtB family transcription factor n=1 Tax=Parachitinimonas caeni TaxID=3031301 RepID=A0ABT7DUZ9_9NEIS|nr:metalloregulator ArsR/SmtB family transcription factor [Parachitinimonas caeni]MDK2123889.1 metalloregulator ArsR/SmtB family transcription factor [Parachitinimonas caeni]
MLNVSVDRVFEALASTPRRKILAYLSEAELTAGEIASRFEMSKPALSKHLRILETAGLIESSKRGQYVWYRLVPNNLVNTLHGFASSICPVAAPLKREGREQQDQRSTNPAADDPGA